MKKLLLLISALTASLVYSQEEVGIVDWGRDVDAALEQSVESGKPVFLLFQEVPG
ncbi:MAG: hypothetical protein AAF226_06190 [Verrucomicrobiota bacterium]